MSAKRKQTTKQETPAAAPAQQNGAEPEAPAETLDVEIDIDNMTLDDLRTMMRFADMDDMNAMTPQETILLIDLLDNLVVGGVGKTRVRDLVPLTNAVTQAMQDGQKN